MTRHTEIRQGRGILLPAAILLAMFSILAATIVLKLANQSLGVAQFSERAQQRRLQARAEVNRLLAQLSEGVSIAEFSDEERIPQGSDGITWKSWVERDPENENVVHLHGEVWETDKGPPGERFSRVVRVSPANKQVHFSQVAGGSDLQLFYRDEGEADWVDVPTTFTPEFGHIKGFYSFDADELGGLFAAEVDESLLPPFGRTHSFRRFDSVSGTWTTLASPPGGALGSVSYGDGQVAALTQTGIAPGVFERVSVYDIEADSWTTLPAPPNQVYDPSGTLQTPTSGSVQSGEIDIDSAGNIYFRPLAPIFMGVDDHLTTLHKWNGTEWSTLPPVPSSLIPAIPGARAGVSAPPLYLNFKQLTATGDGTVAMASSFGSESARGESILVEFDGSEWTRKPLPTVETLYGERVDMRDPLTGEPVAVDPSEKVQYFTTLGSNMDGEIYVGSELEIATLEENSYDRIDTPSVTGPKTTFGLASGSRPIEGENSFETVVSF